MKELAFLNPIIEVIRSINLTPIITLYFGLGCILFLVIYHWSGAADSVENMSKSKKTLLFIFLLIIFWFIYYILYQAGKFNEILKFPIISDAVIFIKSLIPK